MRDYIFTYCDGAYGTQKRTALANIRRTYNGMTKAAIIDMLFDDHFCKLKEGNYKTIPFRRRCSVTSAPALMIRPVPGLRRCPADPRNEKRAVALAMGRQIIPPQACPSPHRPGEAWPTAACRSLPRLATGESPQP